MVAGPRHPCLGTVGYVPRRASKSALRSPLRHIIVELKCTPCLCETSRLLLCLLLYWLPHARALALCEPRLLFLTLRLSHAPTSSGYFRAKGM